MVEQVAGLALDVDQAALIQVAVDRLQNFDPTRNLANGEPLRGRRAEPASPKASWSSSSMSYFPHKATSVHRIESPACGGRALSLSQSCLGST
jgi:hypothetical protein